MATSTATPTALLSIVTWNSADTIEQCLASVLAQDHPNLQVWVVDNDSTDDTCARVQRLIGGDARVQLHALPQNTGFCGGHNYALDRTSTDFVLLVNPDVVLPPDYLSHALRIMERDEHIGTVCGLLVQSDDADPLIDSAGMNRYSAGRFGLRLHGQRVSEARPEAGWVDGADGALPLYRRRFIDDLRVAGHFFDERFFAHKEDWDIAWRGQLYGWRTWFEPGCRAVHPRVFRPGDLTLRRRLGAAIKADAVKNQLLLLTKNAPAKPGFWLRALPRQAAVLAYTLLMERSSLSAYSYIWRHRREVLTSRRLVQARARLGAPVPQAAANQTKPVLSLCVPTYKRPELLERTLRSIGPLPPDVELVISDNSPLEDTRSEELVKRVLADVPATQWRYYHNPPGGTTATNFNLCILRAKGHYVMQFHDDDYFFPGGLMLMLNRLRRTQRTHPVVLFGVDLVDMQERFIRHQGVKQEVFLKPADALKAVLTNSSLVRMPAMIVSRDAYMAAGCLDEQQGPSGDSDMWVRLFAQHGVLRVPETPAAYTIHQGAVTAQMFNQVTIRHLMRMFDKVRTAQHLPAEALDRAQANYFYQFVLAGAYRALQRGDVAEGRQILGLLGTPELRGLPVPVRWLPVRAAFSLLSRLDGRVVRPLLPSI
ncbi:glycosyltransferase [Hymenobacter oligotrophus]|uniref:Glycosyltransferase n=1 Tax=Hymenobacter oligotrophus TaxID=2319843 RepID=A0A3B7QYG8_9BACT|nr:glycosyltransferase family 2 protein [Hymenobacter oligotrophus]AYA36884.1 glycosyltransferase [Hymenobacter oligotrophus]